MEEAGRGHHRWTRGRERNEAQGHAEKRPKLAQQYQQEQEYVHRTAKAAATV